MSDQPRRINTKYCTNQVRVDYAHVGLFDVTERACWVARKRWGISPLRVSHAKLLIGGGQDTSTAEKDRYICYWFNTPNTGDGYVHGYPIDWTEAHLLIRLDPQWNHARGEFIPSHDTHRIDRNVDQQFACGQRIFDLYLSQKPPFPLSWHMIGPRPADSMFYVQRAEGDG